METDNKSKRENPFLTNYEHTPFHLIQKSDYEPAIMRGIEEEDKEIAQITSCPEPPTFENTIVAMERGGELLERVTNTLFGLLHAETSDFLEELATKIAPTLSEHTNNIYLNTKLFERVRTVHDDHAADQFARLGKEQRMLLTQTYDAFTRRGAKLNEEQKGEFRKISAELEVLGLQFAQNKLKATNAFSLHVTDEAELDGLPESSIGLARQNAKEHGLMGWVFTLQAPSYSPFLTYSARRDLREKMYMAYNTLCTLPDSTDNLPICQKIVNLRQRLAQLLGYDTYADLVLTKRMAGKPSNVYALLDKLIEAYMPAARQEVRDVENLYYELNHTDPSTLADDAPERFMPWDFPYYANKLKESRFNINSEMLRPYFELSKVKSGVFGLATRLYGITFEPCADIPVYHPDVVTYKVYDRDGRYLALLYCDFHPRYTKTSGAWMSALKDQSRLADGTDSRPQVSITMNLTKPTGTKPALLTLGEVETFLHEFGHALHGIFSDVTYKSLSCTNVWWDFVELPSQFMENYSVEEDFLNSFATHYETGAAIPADLLRRIRESRNFLAAYACIRQVRFGLIDMAYHTARQPLGEDIPGFEREALERTNLLPPVPGTCATATFSHIMAGGYAAGYYSYKWAEALDADAFAHFRKQGIFSPEAAESFRANILSRGGTEHPLELYKRFRGQEPTIDALLERDGINKGKQ